MFKQLIFGFLATASFLSATLQSVVPQARTSTADKFIIGVLRLDDVIVPFAQYRNGRWLNPWPRPDCYCDEPNNDEPNSLTDQPKP
jgi:hypothetical protein